MKIIYSDTNILEWKKKLQNVCNRRNNAKIFSKTYQQKEDNLK